MKLYICGPMAGYPDLNAAQFKLVQVELEKRGYETVNPHDVQPIGEDYLPPAVAYIRGDLVELLRCQGVATIGNTHCSWGASIEIDLAHKVMIPVRPYELWT